MIAAHPWDLMGAKAAGCEVAFVERSDKSWFALSPKPRISGPTLNEIAVQLIHRSGTEEWYKLLLRGSHLSAYQ